jgi:hypothetical protein
MHASTLTHAPLFSRSQLRYEVACDVMGAVISHHAHCIGQQRSQPDGGNAQIIQTHQQAKSGITLQRDLLDPDDAQAVEAAIAQFGPLARQLYASA